MDELDGFYYTYGATEGTVSIKAGTLEPGNYFSALFINDSYDEVSPRIQFTIKDGTGIRQAKNEDGPLFYPKLTARCVSKVTPMKQPTSSTWPEMCASHDFDGR